MANPLQQLAKLPWVTLLLTAALTNVWVFVLEFFLWYGAERSPLVQDSMALLLSPPLGLITVLAIAVGVGALAVYLLEIVYPNLIINAGVLWALVPCLLLAILIKNFLPLPVHLVALDEGQLIAIILGVFVKGKPYWRR
jgi:hypothetical protein